MVIVHFNLRFEFSYHAANSIIQCSFQITNFRLINGICRVLFHVHVSVHVLYERIPKWITSCTNSLVLKAPSDVTLGSVLTCRHSTQATT